MKEGQPVTSDLRAESRQRREQWNNLGVLAALAGGGVGAWVEGPIGALAGITAGTTLAAGAAIASERFRERRRNKQNINNNTLQ